MQSKSTLTKIGKLYRSAYLVLTLIFLGFAVQAQVYVNGNLSTGATSKSGVAAPAGYTWSEVQNDAGVTTISNTLSGIGTSIGAQLSVADDFTIPAGPAWDITKFTFYAYQTGAPATPSPFDSLRFQIHNGNPAAGATTIVYGDLVANRLTASNDGLMYRVFNTTTPAPGTAPGTTRKIWTLEANVTLSLPPGTYWIEWQTSITSNTAGHFSPPSTVVDMRTVPGYNAQQHDIAAGTWSPVEDDGNPATPPAVALDMPFRIDYSAAGCFGTPTPGNTLSTAATVCAGAPFTLSVATATPGSGVTYQWQSASVVGGPYTDIPGATSETYIATQTAATFYQLVVTCAGSGPGTSTPLQVGIITPPSITAQPASTSICSGTNTSFTATASGGTLTYQWQVSTDGGTTFTDIADGGIYAGATTNTLNLTNVPATNDGYQYQLVVTLTGCGSVTSSVATLTVSGSASITTQPSNVTVCDGSDAVFTVVADGAGVTYQWEVSTDGGTTFTPIAGATTATLTVPAVTPAQNNNQYHVIVSNTCTPAGVTSVNVTLTVSNVATITAQPVDVTVCEGLNASFSVTASATSYQWQVSTDGGATFTDIPGETNTTLTLTAVMPGMNNNQYRLVAFSCGPTGLNSTPAVLTVNAAVTITTPPADVTACVGTDAVFTVTAAGAGPITYQWEASADGGVTFTPIPGATTSTLTIPAVTAAMNGGVVHVVMSNGCTATLTSGNATLTVEDQPSITTQPVSSSVCEGANTSFNVSATGTGLTYQWQVSTDGGTTFNDIGGQTSATLDLSAVPATSNNNQYMVMVFSGCSTTGLASDPATLTVNPAPSITISASPYTSLTTTTTTTITASPATGTFSWFLDGVQVPSATGNSIVVTHSDLGVYTATVVDANGCVGTSNAITITDSTVSNSFIYPNPNRGVFSLMFTDGIEGISVTRNLNVYDAKGARVYTKQFALVSAMQKVDIDLGRMQKGVYILEITDAVGDRIRTEKVLIQ